MFSITEAKKKFIFVFMGVLLFLAALLCSCSQTQKLLTIDFSSLQYVVSLSKDYENKSILVCIDQNGTISQTISFDGQGINAVNYFEGNLYLHSSRENRHFILTGQGDLETFSLDNIELEGSDTAPSWFTTEGENTLIETMNIGYINGHYESAVIYQNNSQKRTVIIEDFCLENAVDYNGKIYLNASDYLGERGNVICVIDKPSGTYTFVQYSHGNTPASGNLIRIKDKIFTYGNNASYLKDMKEKSITCTLGMLDTRSLKTTEVDYSTDFINLCYSWSDKLYVVTESGYIHIYSDDLTLLETIQIDEMDYFDKIYSNNLIVYKKIAEHDDTFSVLFLNSDLDAHNVGFIQEYGKTDLHPIRKIDISLSNVDEWMGETVDFIYLNS
ncbi:MAG: hypothetical protein IJF88_10000 [Oscillospiraceae bacterium]|nr:hypothetical protein [Oscillospiraceae bacterium]